MSSDDQDQVTALALAAGAGDRHALEEFVRRTQHEVWRFVAHLTDVQSADDLTQETFLRVLGSLPRFAGRSSARVWLLSIARRTVVDRIRTAAARPKITQGCDWQAEMDRRRKGAQSDIGEEVVIGQLLRWLPDDRREAFVLTQVFGLSYAEAAEAADCPVGTIRSRVARARETLVELWQEAERRSEAIRSMPRVGSTLSVAQ
ncbi:sigma-70 family RNA polymerase sigma factor [Nocardia brevicatena]|uniref:sigma-70 family RNA polymerase sigma factor n=1 Tax=Nocardia brevicatena TaxID=37327 RepID=UPI0002DA6890|nr:sigma-70 family RNA polymerase sigma factor [Nocardia brevicatena]